MPNIDIKIDGLFLAVVAGAVALGYAYHHRHRFNPASPDNIAYQAAAGEDGIITAYDYIYGAVDLVNPFNESDRYARQVWGLNDHQP